MLILRERFVGKSKFAHCTHSTQRPVLLTGPKGFLIFAGKEALHRVSLDTPDRTDVMLPVSDLEHLMDVDFDPVDKFIYWSDEAVIKRSRMDGTGMYVFCQILEVVRIP